MFVIIQTHKKGLAPIPQQLLVGHSTDYVKKVISLTPIRRIIIFGNVKISF